MLKFISEDVKSTVANRSKLMSVVHLYDIVINYKCFFLSFTGSLFHSRSLTALSSCLIAVAMLSLTTTLAATHLPIQG